MLEPHNTQNTWQVFYLLFLTILGFYLPQFFLLLNSNNLEKKKRHLACGIEFFLEDHLWILGGVGYFVRSRVSVDKHTSRICFLFYEFQETCAEEEEWVAIGARTHAPAQHCSELDGACAVQRSGQTKIRTGTRLTITSLPLYVTRLPYSRFQPK